MGNFNVEMFYDEAMEKQVFYVRPFSEEIKTDLERLMTDVHKVCGNVDITEKTGTYAIATKGEINETTFAESFWGILFRRFSAESRHVCIDPINEEKYYAVIFSAKFISPCERRLAA